MEITINFDFKQALEVVSALEFRIDKINRELFQLFEGDDHMTKAYQEEVKLLQNAINQILGVS